MCVFFIPPLSFVLLVPTLPPREFSVYLYDDVLSTARRIFLGGCQNVSCAVSQYLSKERMDCFNYN